PYCFQQEATEETENCEVDRLSLLSPFPPVQFWGFLCVLLDLFGRFQLSKEVAAASNRLAARVGSSMPSPSMSCIFSSQASNSGARLRPRTLRRYSASWYEVLW